MRDVSKLEKKLNIKIANRYELEYYGISYYFLSNDSSSKLDLNYNCYEVNLYDYSKALKEFRKFKIKELNEIIIILNTREEIFFGSDYYFLNKYIKNNDFSNIFESNLFDCLFKEKENKRMRLAYEAFKIITYLHRIDNELNK